MANPQAEPSMDDILASIRRIIAEEDEPAPKAKSARKAPDAVTREPVARRAPDPVEEVVEEPDEIEEEDDTVAAMPALDEDGLDKDGLSEDDEAGFDLSEDDLTEAAAVDSAEDENESDYDSEDDLDFEVFDDDMTAGASAADDDLDVEDSAPQSNAESIGSLTERVEQTMLSKASAGAAASAFKHLEQNVRVANSNSATLEDIIEKMLEPMLQQWLDTNLPRIVEEKVEEEVRRLARRH